jgi:hypothetical protein
LNWNKVVKNIYAPKVFILRQLQNDNTTKSGVITYAGLIMNPGLLTKAPLARLEERPLFMELFRTFLFSTAW